MEFIVNVLTKYSWAGIIILAAIAVLLIIFLVMTGDKHRKRRAEAPGSLPHRPGSSLLFKGFFPSPQQV